MGQAYTERAEGVNALASAASDKSLDFVEGLAFSPDHSVVMTGTMVDAPDASGRVNRIGKWWKPWFFSRAGAVLAAAHAARARGDARPAQVHAVTEALPLYDYLFRHHRSMCHTMKTVMPFGNSAWFRYPLGWLLPPDVGFLKASHIDETREASLRKQVFQDCAFPIEHLEHAVGLATRLFDIFPLLCYPLVMRDVPGRPFSEVMRLSTGTPRQ